MAFEEFEQYRVFMRKLVREDEPRPVVLNDIKNWLLVKTPEEATASIQNVGITRIVECLNDAYNYRSETLVSVCDVLKLCFSKIECCDNIVKCYTSHIMYLLRHEKECVRKLAIDQVYLTVTSEYHALPMPKYIDVYVATGQMVADTDIGVAAIAVRITSSLPHEAYPKVLDEMKIALEYGTSSKCNAFEVIVNISEKSPELFALAAEMDYISLMVSELQSVDILYKLNLLQIMSKLAVTPHGLNYLVTNGLLQNIADQLRDIHMQEPLYNLLVTGYMKFFGCIAHYYPREIFEKYPVMLDIIFDGFSPSSSSLPVALDTLGFIGTTIEGKLSLVALGSKFTGAVDKVGELIRNSTTDLKIRALNCLANLISIDKDPNKPKTGPVDHRVTLMTREWFRSMNTNAMDSLCTICKNPFGELKLAGLTLLDSVTQHQWGEEMVSITAGFIEYLLDRQMEHTKESKEAKYDIIKRLINSPAFDESTIKRLRTYVEQGPFYAEPGTEVAVMDE